MARARGQVSISVKQKRLDVIAMKDAAEALPHQ